MFQTKLQMRLESGEPKCANCRHWEHLQNATLGPALPGNFGLCNLFGAKNARSAGSPYTFPTTDLSVCSKWEMKDGQAKAEAPSE